MGSPEPIHKTTGGSGSKTESVNKTLKQSTLKMSSTLILPMSGDENTNSNQLQENPPTPMSVQDSEELRVRLAKSQTDLHQMKIENEKNSQLFAMFDQKMKEV